MPDKELIKWCEHEIKNGIEPRKIVELLFRKGYDKKEIEEAMDQAYSNVKSKENTPKTRKERKNDSLLFVILFALFIVFIIIIVLVGGMLSVPREANDEVDPYKGGLDYASPLVSVSETKKEWTGAIPSVSCSDQGNVSSGCNQSSYRFTKIKSGKCPENYSEYEKTLEANGKGFLCIAAKDNEGNLGFSEPIETFFDSTPPKTTINVVNNTIQINDQENGSGLEECYHSVFSGEQKVLDETRKCNSMLTINFTNLCSTNKSCFITARSTDKAGNKGEEVFERIELSQIKENKTLSPNNSSEPSCQNASQCENGKYCDPTENIIYTCGECDDDECIDLCNPINCSDCSCTCGLYTQFNESSVPGGCGDGVDNDCDGMTDEATDCLSTPNCKHYYNCTFNGQTFCKQDTLVVCGQCDNDKCLDACDIIDCSEDDGTGNCKCTCGRYTQNTEKLVKTGSLISCSDGLDNDCDGLIDCADSDCREYLECAFPEKPKADPYY